MVRIVVLITLGLLSLTAASAGTLAPFVFVTVQDLAGKPGNAHKQPLMNTDKHGFSEKDTTSLPKLNSSLIGELSPVLKEPLHQCLSVVRRSPIA